jgi:drug/metabolite transporter (DMT)-like permease
MKSSVRAHLSLFVANLIYAASFTIAKKVTGGPVHPFALVILRASGAVILFWLTDFLLVKEKTDRKDIPRFIMLAFFGVALNQMMFLKGLDLTSPINASIMMITSPILVLIIAAIVIRERITFIKSAGIILGFGGAVMLMMGKTHQTVRGDSMTGDLCVFINALSWGAYLVLVKPLMFKYNTVTILRWVFLFGLIMVIPFGLGQLKEVQWSGMKQSDVFNVLFVIIATTYVAYLLNIYALKALSPSVVSAYIYLQPLLTTIIALWMGSDHLDLLKVVSAAMIFGGVFMVSHRKRDQPVLKDNGILINREDSEGQAL